jgi:cyclohexyl-isocyanide hydratase
MTLRIGFLLFPLVTQLDFTGPAQFFAKLSSVELYYIVKENKDVPVVTDCGFSVLGNTTMKECPKLDLICVPGGSGVHAVMDDEEMLQWLRTIAEEVRHVTAVCTGSLILAAAGLLKGYRATSHWVYRDMLSLFGAIPTHERVVIDRNRITGGGVTAGIDFALVLIQELRGKHEAELIQLYLEYNPQPVFHGGSPDKVSSNFLGEVMMILEEKGMSKRKEHVARTAQRFQEKDNV